MSERKPISKKIRFEVFKRDSFTCQYCGVQAPDTVLHVDHINPIAGGGDNDIMNLITSCEPCNLGKGARELDDNSIIAKQKVQLDELNQRREQLEMMLQWREALSSVDEEYIDAFAERFGDETGCALTDAGRKKVGRWLKKFNLPELLDALEGACETYYKGGDFSDPERNNQLAGEAFDMVLRVANARKRNADKPWMKDLYYIRAIVRNSMYCNESLAIELIERAYHLGAHVEDMKDWAKQAKNWTNWRNEMEEWISELEASGEGEPS